MLLLSVGFTCGVSFSNDGTFTSGTRINVPDRSAGLTASISCCTATMEAYSVPCAPDTIASTGPDFAPCTMATGMSYPASEPAGTFSTPYAFCPRCAVAVPTVNDACGSTWTDTRATAAAISNVFIRQTLQRFRRLHIVMGFSREAASTLYQRRIRRSPVHGDPRRHRSVHDR